MPIFESLNLQPRERPPLHCRLYETYLPPSYLPESCSQYYQFEDGIYYYPKWAWSLINTVFVSTATLINSVFIMIGLFLWMANRQFHFSKKKHSYDKEPLRPLKPLNKAKKSSMKALKKAKRSIINKVRKKRGITIVEDDEKQVPVQFEKVTQNNMHRVKSFSSFLEDVDGDEGELLKDMILVIHMSTQCMRSLLGSRYRIYRDWAAPKTGQIRLHEERNTRFVTVGIKN